LLHRHHRRPRLHRAPEPTGDVPVVS
jgi:hypothetical protein